VSENRIYTFAQSKNAAYLAAGILLSGILIFSWNNRISIDDMFFYARCRDRGISAMIREQYYHYSGRFGAYSLNGFVLLYFNHFMLALWNTVSIICFFFSVRFFIRSCPYLPGIHTTGWVFLFSALLFGSTHPGEEFFWYTQVNTYLWSATCMLLIAGIICANVFTTWGLLLLPVCSSFIAASSESILMQTGLLLVILSAVKWNSFSLHKKLTIVFSFILMCVLGYLSVFSPGNEVRSFFIHEINHTGFFEALAQSVYSYFTSEPAIISYVWAIPFMAAAGFYLNKPLREISFLKATMFYILFLVICMLPSAWALREPAPPACINHLRYTHIFIHHSYCTTTGPGTQRMVTGRLRNRNGRITSGCRHIQYRMPGVQFGLRLPRNSYNS
jgi:hypothetical protein